MIDLRLHRDMAQTYSNAVPEKETKCRVNDDPCILEKWSILDLLSTSRGAFYIGGKKTIDVVLCHTSI